MIQKVVSFRKSNYVTNVCFCSETVSLSIGMTSRHDEFRFMAFPESFDVNKENKDGKVSYRDKKELKEQYKAVLQHFKKKCRHPILADTYDVY